MPEKRILISQPEPSENSPYFDLEKKYNVNFDFRKFFQIEPVASREFRKVRLDLNDYNALIFTSKIAADHYFRVAQKMRFQVPTTMKYFCINETIAQYLSKYIVYRKRKIFFADGTMDDFVDLISKSPDEEFLLPVADNHRNTLYNKLKRKKLRIKKAIFYQIVFSDLSDIDLNYDVIVLFSPSGIKALEENFSDIKKRSFKIAAFGNETAKAVNKAGLKVDIKAPTPDLPSMSMALENYLKNGKAK